MSIASPKYPPISKDELAGGKDVCRIEFQLGTAGWARLSQNRWLHSRLFSITLLRVLLVCCLQDLDQTLDLLRTDLS